MDLEAFEPLAKQMRVLGLAVTRNGEELVRRNWDEEIRRNVYSASKSFTSCAVGMAVREGLVSLEEPLTEAFAGDVPAEPDENLRAATVRDLLTMCLGQEKEDLMSAQREQLREENWVRYALGIPLTHRPGTRFRYSNVGPYLAGVLVQRRAGCTLAQYLTPRIFEPLGFRRPVMWEQDPMGYTFGASGLFLTMSELHRFGLLCLQEGVWNGRQLVPEEWLREASKPQSAAPYGYLFWTGEGHSYRADGKYGQISLILPEKNAVVTVTAECREGDLVQALYREIVPQL